MVTHRGRRSQRAQLLYALKKAWREKGKREEHHIRDYKTGEIDLNNDIPELNLVKGTVLRLGYYRLDVEEVIRREWERKCNELGIALPSRIERYSYAVNNFCTSLIPQFVSTI